MSSKKNRIAVLLLAVLIIGGIAALISFSSRVYATADELVLTQAASRGDIDAADGLVVSLDLVAEDCLSWAGTVSFKDGAANMDLKHEYVYDDHFDKVFYEQYFQKQLTHQNKIFITPDVMQNGALKKYFEETASSMAVGEEKRVSVRLSDYMDKYPISVSYNLSGGGGLDTETDGSQEALYIKSVLSKLFVYPASDEPVEYSVSKYSDQTDSSSWFNADLVMGNASAGEAASGSYPFASGTFLNGKFYIYNYECMADIPAAEGLKIYSIPLETKTITGENYSYTGRFLSVDDIRVLCTLDPGFIMQEAFVTKDEKGVLFFGHDDKDFIAYYMSIVRGALQKKVICSAEGMLENYERKGIFEALDNGFIVLIGDVIYTFCPGGSGKYEVLSYPEDSGSDYLSLMHSSALWSYSTYFCSDGKRLAVAGLINRGYDVKLVVAVYTAEGIQYYGEYDISVLESRKVKNYYQYSNVSPEWPDSGK